MQAKIDTGGGFALSKKNEGSAVCALWRNSDAELSREGESYRVVGMVKSCGGKCVYLSIHPMTQEDNNYMGRRRKGN